MIGQEEVYTNGQDVKRIERDTKKSKSKREYFMSAFACL